MGEEVARFIRFCGFAFDKNKNNFLNQTCAWFLEIDPVRIVGMHVRVCMCLRLRLLITRA